jgi:hypothetical protein
MTSTAYGVSYVVAENSDEAYGKVKRFLDEKNLGFLHERQLDSVELMADEKQYGESSAMLFL